MALGIHHFLELFVGLGVLANTFEPLAVDQFGVENDTDGIWLQRVRLDVDHALLAALAGRTDKNLCIPEVNLYLVSLVCGLILVAEHAVLDPGTASDPRFLSLQNDWSLDVQSPQLRRPVPLS